MMKRFLKTVCSITASILAFTACAVQGGGSVSRLDIGSFVSNSKGLVVSKELFTGAQSFSFEKTSVSGDLYATAQCGYKLDRLTFLVFEAEGTSLVVGVSLELYNSSAPNDRVRAEGELTVGGSVTASVMLDELKNGGHDVLASVSVYPSRGTSAGKGKLSLKGCYLCSGFRGDSLISLETTAVYPSVDPSGGGSSDQSSGNSSGGATYSGGAVGQSSNSSVGQISQSGGAGPVQATYLWQKYSEYFPIGYAIGADHIDWYKGNLDRHYNSFTCENEMKMYVIAPNSLTQYNFAPSDAMINYVASQGKKVRGHALVWYNGAPRWLTDCRDKNQMLDLIYKYVYRVVSHYGDRVYCWDVVNEAVGDDNNFRSCFYDVAGIDYIKTAFRAARTANPNVKLYYNDYNMDKAGKRAKVIEFIRELKRDNVPIDGIGMQGHYNLVDTRIEDVETAIRQFAALGLDIQITELDVKNYGNKNPSGQAELYGKLFELFRKYKDNITGVTFWNVADDYSWMDNLGEFSYYGTGKAYATVFDVNRQKKQAFYKIFDFDN